MQNLPNLRYSIPLSLCEPPPHLLLFTGPLTPPHPLSMVEELSNPRVILKPGIKIRRPLGYESDAKMTRPELKKPSQAQLRQLKIKKAWEFATRPAKNIPMNLIMSYMTGNSLQMIPMMMTLMLLWSPLVAIFTETARGFQPYTTENNHKELLLPKFVFILCQLANMSIGLWKLDKMGIIPYKAADWMEWMVPAQIKETAALLG